MNYDSSITVTRGMDNLSSNLDNANIFSMVPVSSQQLSDMRASIVKWMDNARGPDLRESMYGTTPYTLDYTLKPGWFDDPQKAIALGQGPDWGYAMSRDQYVYLHMVKNQIRGTAKSGFTGQYRMNDIGPFTTRSPRSQWLNEGARCRSRRAGGRRVLRLDRHLRCDAPIPSTRSSRSRPRARSGTTS